MTIHKDQHLTELLRDWQNNKHDSRLDARLTEALYMDLRRMAAQSLARESRSALTPTELVHETWLRLKPPSAPIANRHSFMRLVSVAMRHLLVDQARERLSHKRNDDRRTVTVSLRSDTSRTILDDTQLLDLDLALTQLATDHPRIGEAMVLRIFAGLDLSELAASLGTSLATAKRDLAFGRAWLIAALAESAS